MTFTEKLRYMTETHNKSALSRKAGLPSNAISDYINKGYAPRAPAAARIAKALHVTVDWLVDDDRGLPPEYTESRRPVAAGSAA